MNRSFVTKKFLNFSFFATTNNPEVSLSNLWTIPHLGSCFSSGGGSRGGFGAFNINWNTKWFSGAKVHDGYWTGEFKIPFSSIRYKAGSKTWNFNSHRGNSKVLNDWLFVEGRKLMKVEQLPRNAPHDISNALAAALTATHAGADSDAIIETLRHFNHLPHRIEMIIEHEGVKWYEKCLIQKYILQNIYSSMV